MHCVLIKRPRYNECLGGAQIDLIFDRPDDCITLCEIKYTEKPFSIDKAVADNLANKIKVYHSVTGTSKQTFLAMISASGLKKTVYAEKMVDGVMTMADLFQVPC